MERQRVFPEAHASTLRMVVVTRYRLDGDSLSALFHANGDCRVLCTTTSAKVALVVCRHRRPDVILLDGSLIDSDASRSLPAFVRRIGEVPLLLLDDDANYVRLAAVLEFPWVGYFTRGAPFSELLDGIRRLARGERVFDSVVRSRIHKTPDGWQFRHQRHASVLDPLTPREIEVLRLIALGNTVKDCAEILDLAVSTVDNHKSRLMKKLNIHKSHDLTRLAIREGLIRL